MDWKGRFMTFVLWVFLIHFTLLISFCVLMISMNWVFDGFSSSSFCVFGINVGVVINNEGV